MMFKVYGTFGISKIKFFEFSGVEMVKALKGKCQSVFKVI